MSEASFSPERREFFRRLGRRAAGAGVVVLTAVLLGRNGDATAVPACAGAGQCRCCALTRTCALPAAARRRAGQRENRDA